MRLTLTDSLRGPAGPRRTASVEQPMRAQGGTAQGRRAWGALQRAVMRRRRPSHGTGVRMRREEDRGLRSAEGFGGSQWAGTCGRPKSLAAVRPAVYTRGRDPW